MAHLATTPIGLHWHPRLLILHSSRFDGPQDLSH
jgi:hypothetical protein